MRVLALLVGCGVEGLRILEPVETGHLQEKHALLEMKDSGTQ